MASKPIKELKPGNAYTENNELFQCISNEQMKTGRLSGNYIVKRKNMRKGGIDQTSYTPNAKVEIVTIEKNKMSFSYVDGTDYVFMNNETYDMVNIPVERLEWEKNFIVDNLEVDVTTYEGEVIGVATFGVESGQSLNFAVSVLQIKKLTQNKKNLEVQTSF